MRTVTGKVATTRPDARRERWTEHRNKVRSEIVDAAFLALDQFGPEVSLQQIAAEAGTARSRNRLPIA